MYLLQDKAGGNHVAEATLFKWPNQEADLVSWWIRQARHHSDLRATEGERLIVLDAGVRNDGPGPDIFNAHIMLDDLEYAGNVEMHWSARDWYHHHHHRDPAYAGVILHVVVNSENGPDIATLAVAPHLARAKMCLAQRPISDSELLTVSWNRYSNKKNHLIQLANTEYSPHLLGMIEIIYAGKGRHKYLQTIAVQLGLSHWPGSAIWRGSNQSFSRTFSRSKLVGKLLNHYEVFDAGKWEFELPHEWADWDSYISPLFKLGFSQNQVKEWVVNILAPHISPDEGFDLWVNTPVFRHYGVEKQMLTRLNIDQVNTIAIQQSVLEWQSQLCASGKCAICPLSHSLRS